MPNKLYDAYRKTFVQKNWLDGLKLKSAVTGREQFVTAINHNKKRVKHVLALASVIKMNTEIVLCTG
jgi:hypothetical protein